MALNLANLTRVVGGIPGMDGYAWNYVTTDSMTDVMEVAWDAMGLVNWMPYWQNTDSERMMRPGDIIRITAASSETTFAQVTPAISYPKLILQPIPYIVDFL